VGGGDQSQEPGVGVEAVLAGHAERGHGIVAAGLPGLGVDRPKHGLAALLPRPAQVQGQVKQGCQGLGDSGVAR